MIASTYLSPVSLPAEVYLHREFRIEYRLYVSLSAELYMHREFRIEYMPLTALPDANVLYLCC